MTLRRLGTLALAAMLVSCTRWASTTQPLPDSLPADATVEVWSGDGSTVLTALSLTDDSLSGSPPSGDARIRGAEHRVAIARADVDSVRFRESGASFEEPASAMLWIGLGLVAVVGVLVVLGRLGVITTGN